MYGCTVPEPVIATHPPAAAKLRILATANRLFYGEGIRAAGVDRLISESSVTKATFYKHYGSKDRLVVAYIEGQHDSVRGTIDGLVNDSATPRAALDAVFSAISAEIQAPAFRGCPFINAAGEYTDPGHAVRVAIMDHRDWYTSTLSALLGRIDHPLPGDGADELLLARDGAMAGAYAGDPIAAAAAFNRATARVLADTRP